MEICEFVPARALFDRLSQIWRGTAKSFSETRFSSGSLRIGQGVGDGLQVVNLVVDRLQPKIPFCLVFAFDNDNPGFFLVSFCGGGGVSISNIQGKIHHSFVVIVTFPLQFETGAMLRASSQFSGSDTAHLEVRHIFKPFFKLVIEIGLPISLFD